MELETRDRTSAASRQYIGDQTFAASPGQTLKIETSPDGIEILNVVCPAGCSWTVHVTVAINELDN